MRKLFVATFVAIVLLASVSMASLGNSYTLNAENGRIMAPAGVGLELQTNFSKQTLDQGITPGLSAELSYGALPFLTLAGEFTRVNNDGPQVMAKAYLSQSRDGMGYTLYGGYDLNKTEIANYGVSLWSNLHFFYAFLNLESQPQQDVMLATPGANLMLGSKLRLSGEIAFKMDSYQRQDMSFGVSYALTPKIQAKVSLTRNYGPESGNVFNSGLVVGL